VTLPPVDDPQWAAAKRGGRVVERLLELIAGHGEYARLDALSGLLDLAYRDRLASARGERVRGGRGHALAGGRQRPAHPGERRWIASAERRPAGVAPLGLSIDEIHGARRGCPRRTGSCRLFHAEQMALAEAMAQVIAGEASGRSVDPVDRNFGELTFASGVGRGSVLAQIEHAERAMLAMWLLRFEEGEG
jgi:hypothetical protein